eukprot:14075608-Alexandrium_andersonii.AAC.1
MSLCRCGRQDARGAFALPFGGAPSLHDRLHMDVWQTCLQQLSCRPHPACFVALFDVAPSPCKIPANSGLPSGGRFGKARIC